MSAVPQFHALEWQCLNEQWVAIVECDKVRDRDNTGLWGPVVIDGETFECVGVWRNAPAFPIQLGEKIGLIVRGVKS